MRLCEGIACNFRHKIRPLEANLVKKFGVRLHTCIGKLEPFKAMRLFFSFLLMMYLRRLKKFTPKILIGLSYGACIKNTTDLYITVKWTDSAVS
jgi:hypothetical protein